MASGEEANIDKDQMNSSNQQGRSHSLLTPGLQHRINEISIPVMSASTRRNKRKNFQPRNIRPNESPDGSEDNDLQPTNNQIDGEDDPPAGCSESKIVVFASRHSDLKIQYVERKSRIQSPSSLAIIKERSLGVGQVPPADGYNPDMAGTNSSESSQTASHSGSRDSSRNSSRSSSRSSSRCGKNAAAVDLRLRPVSNTEDDDQEDEENEEISGLQMKTWMLFWQQQQSCSDSSLRKPPFPMASVSHKCLDRTETNAQTEETGSKQADETSATNNYAETAMRELLGIYRLQRDAAPG